MLRFMLNKDDIAAMRAAGPVKEYDTARHPLVRLMAELTQQTGCNLIQVSKPGFLVAGEKCRHQARRRPRSGNVRHVVENLSAERITYSKGLRMMAAPQLTCGTNPRTAHHHASRCIMSVMGGPSMKLVLYYAPNDLRARPLCHPDRGGGGIRSGRLNFRKHRIGHPNI